MMNNPEFRQPNKKFRRLRWTAELLKRFCEIISIPELVGTIIEFSLIPYFGILAICLFLLILIQNTLKFDGFYPKSGIPTNVFAPISYYFSFQFLSFVCINLLISLIHFPRRPIHKFTITSCCKKNINRC